MSQFKKLTAYSFCTVAMGALIKYKEFSELPQFIYNQVHEFQGWEHPDLKEFVDKLAGDAEDDDAAQQELSTLPEKGATSFSAPTENQEPLPTENPTEEPPPGRYLPVVNCQTGEIIYYIKLE